MPTNDSIRSSRRPAVRAMILLMVCSSMLAFSVDRAYAIQPITPQVSQLVDGSSLVSTSPFTFISTVNGTAATLKVAEPSPGTLVASIDTAGISVRTEAVDNGDGTATYTTTGPNGYLDVKVEPTTVSASGGCTDWSCIAVIGASSVAAGAVCFFTAGWGCAAAGAAAATGSGAYCEIHDCETEIKCTQTVDAWNATGTQGTSGRAVHYQNAVDCNYRMQRITLTTQLFKGSTPVFAAHTRTCYEAYSCWDGWIAWNLPAGCYHAKGSFTARWHDPTTNAVKDFAGNKTSRQICFS